jgi:hypothetical protein
MLALGAGTAEDCGKQLAALRAQLAATEPEFIATARSPTGWPRRRWALF